MSTTAETVDVGATLDPSGTVPGKRDTPAERLTKGDALGRYIILRLLGVGGMGAVYLAYDPELDRKVALKLLRGSVDTADPRDLQREAQAMAKLRHPNVVTVYDVGQHYGRVYVAMEYIEGMTLSAWAKAKRRGWRDVLDKFVEAGRGLEAAHAEQLVHRDFKPENVLTTESGRVAVMDFGLARPSRTADAQQDVDVGALQESLLDTEVDPRIAGTPAYMAPEQLMGTELTAAVDQFAFCVSIWECVCGRRPYEGDGEVSTLVRMAEYDVNAPPAGARMPGWLERVLMRGLAPVAEDRWPSMETLLAALDRGRGRWRWQVGVAAVTAVVLVGSAVWGWQRQREAQRLEALAACDAEGAAIDQLWNAEARDRIRSGLLATGAPFAASSLDIFIPWLDDYRDAWSSGRIAACRHGSIERDWDEALLDRSRWCFEDRRLQLEATVEQIATLQTASARRAVRIASYLDPVDQCLDPNLLRRLPAPPTAMRDEIRAIRSTLSESDRFRHAGYYSEALDMAVVARERAAVLGWSPLLALARLIEGSCLAVSGEYGQAELALTTAYFEAQDTGSVEVAFRAARSLTRVHASLHRDREAELWARHADVLSSGLEDPKGLDAAEGHYMLTSVFAELGDYDAAAWHGEQAVAMRAATLGHDHPLTAASSRNLGRIYTLQDRLGEALERLEGASAIWEQAVGREHPYMAEMAMLRGDVLVRQGHVDRGLELLREGLVVSARVHRQGHPKIARVLVPLGEALLELGRIDEAEQAFGRAAEIQRAEPGQHFKADANNLFRMSAINLRRGDHETALRQCAEGRELLQASSPSDRLAVVEALDCAANAYRYGGRPDDAVPQLRDVLARHEEVFGPEHRRLMTPLLRLGDVLREAGQLQPARASYTRVVEVGQGDAIARTGRALVSGLVGLAEVALAEHDGSSAVVWAERAVDMVEEQGMGPRLAAVAHFAAARALRATHQSEDRARSLAVRARDEFEAFHDERGRAEVERWLGSGGVEPGETTPVPNADRPPSR
ncbi:MAG: serine/threonine-protein kinase [Deltaproteobacteria bacterium]|nr:serine/threonine-protein kinase [Deltaproteobacteria bacterium]